jgi:hypothetical protein
MGEFIGRIFYFGSPKDGFKVYPDAGPIHNLFSGYNSNSGTDWLITAQKAGSVVRVTYVRYGLITGVDNPREGSCLGISVEFLNHYFTNLEVYRVEIMEKMWTALVKGGYLLEAHETSGVVAFKSFDLADVGQYLDDMSGKIENVIREKFVKYLRLSYDIPDAGENPGRAFHPQSSARAITEAFVESGTVTLSPNAPIESKSAMERQEEERTELRNEVERLSKNLSQVELDRAERLKVKESELGQLRSKLGKIETIVNTLIAEFPPAEKVALADQRGAVHPLPNSATHRDYDPYVDPKRLHRTGTEIGKSESRVKAWSKWLLGVLLLIVVLSLVIYGTLYLLGSTDTKPGPVVIGAVPGTVGPRSTPQSNSMEDPFVTKSDAGGIRRFLNVQLFLAKNKGKRVSNEDEFGNILATYLFANSAELAAKYNNDKTELWLSILNTNAGNRKSLREYLAQKPDFEIADNPEQAELLRDLLIYVK